jgi:hypothetical protein
LAGAPAAYASVEGVQNGWNGMLDGIENFMKDNPLQKLREQAVKKYGLLINPYFKMGFDFTSNTFRAPNDGREDVIWTFTPGFNATYNHDYGQIGLSYEADFVYFSKHEDQHEQNQVFAVYSDIYPTDNLSISVSEELSQEGAIGGAPGLEPLNYRDNTVSAIVAYTWGSLVGEVGYTNFDREYNGDIFDTFSYNEDQWTFYVYHDVTENLRANVGYELGMIGYDETSGRNATYHEYATGVEGSLPGDIKYAARGAFHVRRLNISDFNNYWWVVGDVNLSKKINDAITVYTGFVRRPVEATFATVPVYDEKSLYAGANYKVTENVRGKFGINFANRDFEEISAVGSTVVKRDDDVFGLNLGVDWAARKWLVFNLGYGLERRNSNISSFDYTENKLTTGVTIPM